MTERVYQTGGWRLFVNLIYNFKGTCRRADNLMHSSSAALRIMHRGFKIRIQYYWLRKQSTLNVPSCENEVQASARLHINGLTRQLKSSLIYKRENAINEARFLLCGQIFEFPLSTATQIRYDKVREEPCRKLLSLTLSDEESNGSLHGLMSTETSRNFWSIWQIFPSAGFCEKFHHCRTSYVWLRHLQAVSSWRISMSTWCKHTWATNHWRVRHVDTGSNAAQQELRRRTKVAYIVRPLDEI